MNTLHNNPLGILNSHIIKQGVLCIKWESNMVVRSVIEFWEWLNLAA
jgi:hypothetical protein